MPRQSPSPRVRELIREGMLIAIRSDRQWLEELDQAILTAHPAIANDPALASVIRRSSRAGLEHWAAANVRNPGAPVSADLGPESQIMVRDLVRRGLDPVALHIYRIGQYLAWRRWMDVVFELTSDPQELHELLTVSSRSVNEFVEATLARITAQVQAEHDELARGTHAERREVVELILSGAPISPERAETRLGYPLNRTHTAAVIWSDTPDRDQRHLDRAADAFGHAVGAPRPLTVLASTASRWVWVADAATFDADKIRKAVNDVPRARIAIGTTAPGMEGFRRSHLDALSTQRTLTRLHSPQQVALFADVQMAALITQNYDGANEFIQNTLGRFESASVELQTTVLTFIKEQCNASRAARILHTHRNTLLRRLEAAQRLLPHPLDHTALRVGVALEALQWRGKQTD